MPDEFILSDHVNEDGSFNADGPGLATLAGEEHKDSGSYKDTKDFTSFVKAAFDTHAKVGKKLENVIQKPAADASDEDRAVYKASLKTELGAVKSGAEFEFVRPAELPKGMQYDEDMEAQFRELFAQIGLPKEDAETAYEAYNKYKIAKHNTAVEAKNKLIAAGDEELRAEWVGEDMLKNTRIAYAAFKALGAEAFPNLWNNRTLEDGTEFVGLEARLKEAKVFDSPGNFDKWRECGVDTSQLRLFYVLGKRMLGADILTAEGAGGVEDKGGEFNKACSSKSSLGKG